MVKNSMFPAVMIMLLLVTITFSSPSGAGETQIQEKVCSPSTLRALNALAPGDEAEIIVQFTGGVKDVDEEVLSALRFQTLYTYHVIPAVYVKGSAEAVSVLSGYERVKRIDINFDIELDMELSLSVINATRTWNRIINGSGSVSHIDGTGVTCVVVDTGIDAGHPDLDYREKTIMNLFLNHENGYTWVEMENTDFDYGHGTHVAGTVAGNGDASAGARAGVAPGANLIGLTLVDPTVADYLISLEWVYDNSRPNANPYNIRLATNSWHVEAQDHGVYDPDAPLTQVIEKLAFENNVVSTWSAGNHGRDDPEGEHGLTSPQGNTPVAIMCAAYERDGSAVTDFSSKGMRGLNHTYPDIGAPGRSIWSAHARRTVISAGSKLGGNPNPYYLAISGTSMSTPHVAGLVALLWQAAPSLTISDRHEDYSGEDDSWWENPATRIHEIEWIMEATATYLPPTEEHGVPVPDNMTGADGRPMDYCQGYGIIDAEKAVAVALTLERLRKMHPHRDITVADALRSYGDMMVTVEEEKPTNVLSVAWEGEYSRWNDQFGRSLTTVNQTKNLFVPENVKKVIVDLAYDPVDASEMASGDISFTIDFDNDGAVDYTGGLSPVLSGTRHEELDVDPQTTDALWAFGIVGQGFKLQNPLRQNSYMELRIEYSMSVQLVVDGLENDTLFINFEDDNSMIAPLRFGISTSEYSGGDLEMNVNYYDLGAVKLKEGDVKPPGEEERLPPWFFPLVGLILIIVAFAWRRIREQRKPRG
ncbi:MAG: S8 family serine peptidase [Thermoplasmata archaeon]|nr:MAG: S8 family serine peptidase [Thermoplasmata archaeon]